MSFRKQPPTILVATALFLSGTNWIGISERCQPGQPRGRGCTTRHGSTQLFDGQNPNHQFEGGVFAWYRLIYLGFIHSTWWRIFWYLKPVYESRVERACCFSMPSGSCSVRISSLGEASDHCRLGMGLQWFQIAMWKPTLTWYFQILKVTCQIMSNLLWHRRLMFAVSRVQCRGLRLLNAYSVESFNSRVGSHLQLRPSQWSSSSRFYWSWAVGWCLMAREVYDTCLYPLSEKKHWLNDCFLANLMPIVHRSKAKPAMTAWVEGFIVAWDPRKGKSILQ